jgi:hypothetical protein
MRHPGQDLQRATLHTVGDLGKQVRLRREVVSARYGEYRNSNLA